MTTKNLIIRGLDPELHRRLRIAAAQSEITVKELVIKILVAHVPTSPTVKGSKW